jgi:hypothetical protein
MSLTAEYPTVDTATEETTEQPVEDHGVREGEATVEETTTTKGNLPQGKKGPVTDDFNPDTWQLKYRDQTIKPKDRNHLISLAQQGFSYSQRMAELKAREQEIETNRQRYEQYEKLEAAFEKNPKFRDQIFEWYQQSFTPAQQQQQQQQVQQQAGTAQIPPELIEEITALKQWREEQQQQAQQQQAQQADQQVMGEIEKLKEKYPRDDWDSLSSNGVTLIQEIVKHALDNGGIKLETAYRDLMWDTHVRTTEAETLKKAAEDKKAAAKAGIVSGGKSKGAKAPEPTTQAVNYDEAEKHIKELYNIKQES